MALAILPASAPAAINIVDYNVSSANTQAGANSDVDVHMQFCSELPPGSGVFCTSNSSNTTAGGIPPYGGEMQNGIRSLAISFPPGLIAATNSVPRCPLTTGNPTNLSGVGFDEMSIAKNGTSHIDYLCPRASEVGTVSIETVTTGPSTTTSWPALQPSTDTTQYGAIARIYNLAPVGSEAGRLGIFIEPDGWKNNGSVIGFKPIRLTVPIVLNTSNGLGATATTSNLLRHSLPNGFDLRPWSTGPTGEVTQGPSANAAINNLGSQTNMKIVSMTMKFYGHTPLGTPFMENPTSCDAGYAHLEATSYYDFENGVSAGRDVPYQATGCSSVPFAPSVTASAGGAGQTAPNSSPPVNLAVDVPDEQASLRDARVVLPAAIRPNVASLASHACAPSSYSSESCPAGARIGSLTLHSPLADGPISGPIYLVKDEAAGALRVKLKTKLGGAVPMDIDGSASFTGNRSVASFTDLPDVPVSDFSISLYGGGDGIFTAVSDLCETSLSADSTLTGANGKTVNGQIPIKIEGCGGGSSASIVSSVADVDSGYAPVVVGCAATGSDVQRDRSSSRAAHRRRSRSRPGRSGLSAWHCRRRRPRR